MRTRSILAMLALALLGVACAGEVAGSAPPASTGAARHTDAAGTENASASGAAPLCGSLAGTPVDVRSVVVIVMENHSYGQLIGPAGSAVARGAPYLNGTLKKQCGLATGFRAITHPSLPNYIGMVAGTRGGIVDDCTSCSTAVSSLFGQLRRAGRQWRVYAEGMPERCSQRSVGRYVKRHNPATYFPAIAADCRRWDLPMGGSTGYLDRALRNDNLQAFSMVVPDMCNSMHDCSVATGDAWLRRWVPRIAATPSYRTGHMVMFVIWDEGSGGSGGEDCLRQLGDESCHIPAFVVSALTPGGARSSTRFSLYSMLRTTESLLGLPRRLGKAATATGMRPYFGLR
jgi:phospholipase C